MKRKIALSVALLLLVVSFVGCELSDVDDIDMPTDTNDDSITEKQPSYKDIVCVEGRGFETFYFSADNNDNTVIGAMLPKQWTLKKNTDG